MIHVAPDLGSCTRDICGCSAGPDFFCFRYPGRSRQHAATGRRSLTKEPVTGAIAWIVLAAGIANAAIPGRRSQNWIPAFVCGSARTPILLFADHPLNGQLGRHAHR